MGSLSIWHWLIVLLVVVLIFGTKKLRNIGQDLGGAVKGFKEGVKGANEDEQIGVDIIRRAIEYPAKHLAMNGGYEGSVVVQEIKKRKGNEGFNAASGEYEDLVKAGVVDPKKVTRSALQNAASIAGLLLTTECLITEIPEKEKPAPAGGGHGGGMGGMDY